MLWYHSRFSWTPEQQRALLVPGNDFHFLVPCGDGGFVKQRAVLQPTAAADAYFRRLLRPLAAVVMLSIATALSSFPCSMGRLPCKSSAFAAAALWSCHIVAVSSLCLPALFPPCCTHVICFRLARSRSRLSSHLSSSSSYCHVCIGRLSMLMRMHDDELCVRYECCVSWS